MRTITTRTYTVLVTITDNRLLGPDMLAEHLAAVLEKGCKGWTGMNAATVDALRGDYIQGAGAHGAQIKALHKSLRNEGN